MTRKETPGPVRMSAASTVTLANAWGSSSEAGQIRTASSTPKMTLKTMPQPRIVLAILLGGPGLDDTHDRGIGSLEHLHGMPGILLCGPEIDVRVRVIGIHLQRDRTEVEIGRR